MLPASRSASLQQQQHQCAPTVMHICLYCGKTGISHNDGLPVARPEALCTAGRSLLEALPTSAGTGTALPLPASRDLDQHNA